MSTRLFQLLVLVGLIVGTASAQIFDSWDLDAFGTYDTSSPSQATSGKARLSIGTSTVTVSYTTTWNPAFDSITSNGSGGNCLRGSGIVKLTATSADVLTLEYASTECDTGSVIGALTNNGAFRITSGTGRFSGIKGAGNLVWAAYGNTPGSLAFLHIEGNALR